ncbi:MAG: class I SAM-dependent methyltransferase [Bacteroidales bacterium]|nr:class I SAM-dependent methyltransferase [Bacteroidales bacterium]
METIGSKPSGIKGWLAGIIMNIIHGVQYKKIIQKYIIKNFNSPKDIVLLDIGCGGGKAINLFSSMLKNSKIYGIDHSADMVSLSKSINKKAIFSHQVQIFQADAKNIPFDSNYFDAVTAFDTINFWDDYGLCMNEIKRVLKQNGMFFIVNGYPKPGTKWYDFVKFKNEKEYESFLIKHGFSRINTDIENHAIIIWAIK